MKSGYQTRLLAILLAVLTLGAVGLAIANLSQESDYTLATDGARMTELADSKLPTGLLIYSVPADSAAEKAGLRKGDILLAINDHPTPRLASAERAIAQSGIYSKAAYTIVRSTTDGRRIQFDVQVILEKFERADYQVMRLIALVYLAIGLYVLFRRWTAPKSTHFFVFCLVSFVLYAFKYTGQFDALDEIVLWCNIAAFALQPAMFLHFAGSFSEDPAHRGRLRLLYPLLYLPGAVLILLRYLSLEHWSATGRLQHRLDQVGYAYLAVFYLIAAAVFWLRYHAEQQTPL